MDSLPPSVGNDRRMPNGARAEWRLLTSNKWVYDHPRNDLDLFDIYSMDISMLAASSPEERFQIL